MISTNPSVSHSHYCFEHSFPILRDEKGLFIRIITPAGKTSDAEYLSEDCPGDKGLSEDGSEGHTSALTPTALSTRWTTRHGSLSRFRLTRKDHL